MRILISGAGMAGLSTGITLGRHGHDVTIIERAGHLRTNGSPIDIRGDAVEIAERIGLLEQVRATAVSMTEQTQFINADGTVVAELPGAEVSDSEHDIEIPREGLARILHAALDSDTELRFADSIAHLDNGTDGVDVRFLSGAEERFDLVVGADGMHSLTRRLVFGPENDYLHHLGFYVALADMPTAESPDRRNPILNWPGHMIGITRYDDVALAVMNFRAPWIDYDYHDLDAQKKIVLNAFDGHDEWRVPEILDAVRDDPELYFDSVSQIHMSRWNHGRVVLVGDAAHCASGLSGRGASLALTGAWHLAEALAGHPNDLSDALADYEVRQRPAVTRAQASAGPGGDLVVPATQEDIEARNARLRQTAA